MKVYNLPGKGLGVRQGGGSLWRHVLGARAGTRRDPDRPSGDPWGRSRGEASRALLERFAEHRVEGWPPWPTRSGRQAASDGRCRSGGTGGRPHRVAHYLNGGGDRLPGREDRTWFHGLHTPRPGFSTPDRHPHARQLGYPARSGGLGAGYDPGACRCSRCAAARPPPYHRGFYVSGILPETWCCHDGTQARGAPAGCALSRSNLRVLVRGLPPRQVAAAPARPGPQAHGDRVSGGAATVKGEWWVRPRGSNPWVVRRARTDAGHPVREERYPARDDQIIERSGGESFGNPWRGLVWPIPGSPQRLITAPPSPSPIHATRSTP